MVTSRIHHFFVSSRNKAIILNPVVDRSFMSLGGDSITAMQVKGQCSKHGIGLAVQDILRSKSIAHLAQCVKPIENLSNHAEVAEQDFNLSPIQQLYFKLPNQGQGHFNQSFFLRVTRRIQESDLRAALEVVIRRHSMLRARFSQPKEKKDWQQRITNDVLTSYRLSAYTIRNSKEANQTISDTQTSLNIVNGPVFAADLFEVDGEDQLLFMVGHLLVIDLVSWRVILEDIEELLSSSFNSHTDSPLSFQAWCRQEPSASNEIVLNLLWVIHPAQCSSII